VTTAPPLDEQLKAGDLMGLTVEEAGKTTWYMRPVALCAVGVARVLSRLSPLKLRRTLEFVARGSRPATAEEAARARDAVTAVSARCRGDWCLPRSIATVLVSRVSGRWPDWCAGVRVFPFAAHAWVEVDGVAIKENPAMMEPFTTTVRVSAPATK